MKPENQERENEKWAMPNSCRLEANFSVATNVIPTFDTRCWTCSLWHRMISRDIAHNIDDQYNYLGLGG